MKTVHKSGWYVVGDSIIHGKCSAVSIAESLKVGVRAAPSNILVRSRTNWQVGVMTGESRICSIEGCRGEEVLVRWHRKGKHDQYTWCCTKGMTVQPDGSQKIDKP